MRPCWYRAFVDNRPAGIVVDSPEHFDVLCRDLTGLQRQACVTAVSVIGPADPAAQLQLCAQLQGAADAESCIRGTKVQNLLSEPPSALVDLIGRCELFAGPTRAACYRWLGKTIAVVTDGAFAETGCSQLEPDARRCAATARRPWTPRSSRSVELLLAEPDDVVGLVGRRRRAEAGVDDVEPPGIPVDRRRHVEVGVGQGPHERRLRQVA